MELPEQDTTTLHELQNYQEDKWERLDPWTPVPGGTIGNTDEDKACFITGPLSLVTACVIQKTQCLLDLHGQRRLLGRIVAFDVAWNAVMTDTTEFSLDYNKEESSWEPKTKFLGTVFVPGTNIRVIWKNPNVDPTRPTFCGFKRKLQESLASKTQEWETIEDLGGTIELVDLTRDDEAIPPKKIAPWLE